MSYVVMHKGGTGSSVQGNRGTRTIPQVPGWLPCREGAASQAISQARIRTHFQVEMEGVLLQDTQYQDTVPRSTSAPLNQILYIRLALTTLRTQSSVSRRGSR